MKKLHLTMLLVILYCFVPSSTGSYPSTRTVYYLHTSPTTWMGASETCERYDGHLVKADNVTSLRADFQTLETQLNRKYKFSNLTSKVWVGLYKAGGKELMWHKCHNVTNVDNIYGQLSSSSESCVSMDTNYQLSPTKCTEELPYICQVDEGQCWFLPVENKQFKIESNETSTDGLNECAKKCRNRDRNNSIECWAFYVDSSNSTCHLYLTSERHTYLSNNSYLTDSVDTTVYLKVCVGGDSSSMKALSSAASYPALANCTHYKDQDSWLEAVCYCDCDQPPIILSPEYLVLTPEEKIEKIISELLVDASNTSASFRKLNSIDDKRPSARSIGSLGIILICLVFGGIVLLDLNVLVSHISSLICTSKDSISNKK
ncbi:Snaclec 3 [Biomphalaria pfeifferi]|uniref:Snaclec 3 n=1 Tax=Biomphalaria pfeifferi TaxID=112525 RepID=A0AAD8FLZ0_BIOPF|nr:Snaclec 3 [Biomphalaria pfeifferi]